MKTQNHVEKFCLADDPTATSLFYKVKSNVIRA